MPDDRDTVRTFICIDLPASIKSRIDALEGDLRKIDAQVSWVRSANVHLTIKFLGDVSATALDRVFKVVARAAAGVQPFEIEVSGAGAFPSTRSPRVLWIGLGGAPEPLKTLHREIEQGLAAIGFPAEKRSFSPHLTIGRFRSARNAQLVVEKLAETGFDAESFTARQVIVMRSDLKPTGAIYTPQYVVDLGQPAA